MIERSLKGASVRDSGRRAGWVLDEDVGKGLKVGWAQDGLRLKEETLVAGSQRIREVSCLVLGEGWVPLTELLGIDERDLQVEQKAADARQALDEATKYWPFAYKSRLGPGPRGRRMRQKDTWKCKCTSYVCTCRKGKGKSKKSKTVRIDPGYKASYNKEYYAWRKGKKKRPKKKREG